MLLLQLYYYMYTMNVHGTMYSATRRTVFERTHSHTPRSSVTLRYNVMSIAYVILSLRYIYLFNRIIERRGNCPKSYYRIENNHNKWIGME